MAEKKEDDSYADLWIVFCRTDGGRPYVASTHILLEPTLSSFRKSVLEWASVDLGWWCETHELVPWTKDIRAGICRLDPNTGVVSPVVEEPAYQAMKNDASRKNRQFVLLDANPPFESAITPLR
jgi:hypothetical protein